MARAVAIGREPEVTHPHESLGQHLQEEGANQFLQPRGRQVGLVTVAVLLVGELYRFTVEANESAIVQCDATAIAAPMELPGFPGYPR